MPPPWQSSRSDANMNPTGLLVLILAAVLAVASAFPPVEEYKVDEEGILVPEEYGKPHEEVALNVPEEHGLRFRRATCDLLSFNIKGLKLNHSACAAHCIAMRKGYKGGYCKKTVCHCRK